MNDIDQRGLVMNDIDLWYVDRCKTLAGLVDDLVGERSIGWYLKRSGREVLKVRGSSQELAGVYARFLRSVLKSGEASPDYSHRVLLALKPGRPY